MKETTLVLLQMKNGAISDSRLKSCVSLTVLEKGDGAKRKIYTSFVLHKFFLQLYLDKVKKRFEKLTENPPVNVVNNHDVSSTN